MVLVSTTLCQSLINILDLVNLQFHYQPCEDVMVIVSIVQAAKLHKIADMREGEEESVMYTQEYIRKVIEDVDEDGDFTRGSWRSVIEFVDVDGGS
ncbi:hypothetical protein Tco_1158534 [Tanacetum coccineum]